jgi:hypothetical protein
MGAASARHSLRPCCHEGERPERLGRPARRGAAASCMDKPRTKSDLRIEGLMVRSEGLEPPRCYPLPPQGSASTNSATSAKEKPEPEERRYRISGARVPNRSRGDKARPALKYRIVDGFRRPGGPTARRPRASAAASASPRPQCGCDRPAPPHWRWAGCWRAP